MEKSVNTQRVHIKISGDVQGVGFRYTTIETARSLGLVGWVRNVTGGGVEIVAEGEKNSLERLIEWCKGGPTFGKVANTEVEWQNSTGEFSGFEVEY